MTYEPLKIKVADNEIKELIGNGKHTVVVIKTKAIDIIDKLHDSGELRNLVSSGLISENIILWRKIWHCYHSEIDKGLVKTQAVENVSEVFGVDTRTVYRVLKRMRK